MTPSLRLIATSAQIVETCRAVEQIVEPVTQLAGLSIPVEVLATFDNLPEAERSQVMKDTFAAYRRSTKTIYINQKTFFVLSPLIQQAVFGHEIAHALAHRDSLMEKTVAYSELGDYAEEFLADRLACSWGFFIGLREERNISYGPRYVAALEQWPDEGRYCRAMHLWRQQKIAGILDYEQ